jgi:PAS domain S-box-containing protein
MTDPTSNPAGRRVASEPRRPPRPTGRGGLDLRALVERHLDAVTLVVDGKILFANRMLTELTGFSGSEALGRQATEFFAPADRERARERIADLVRGGDEYSSEYELLCKDGGKKPVEIQTRVIDYQGKLALLSVIRDLSDQKHAEAKLLESEERYRVLYEDNPSMYFIVDSRGVVLSVNKFGAEQLGYVVPDLEGRSVLHVFHPEDRVAVERQLAECLANPGRVDRWEFRKNRKDGSVLWVRERARTVRGADGAPIVLIVCEDVTDQKEAEEERRILEEQVRHAQKLESLGLMAGGIAHDFNNLLVGILGNASLALTKLGDDTPARSNIESLEKAACRAAELCKQLLAYSGRGRFEVEPVDVSHLVGDLIDLLEVAVPRKRALRYELQSDLPAIEGDASQLRQIVMNLVTNAAEAIGDAPGWITVGTNTIEFDEPVESSFVGTVPAGHYVCLEVSDSGCGMDQDVLDKMFDPFFTTKFTGRGLGLAAVLGIVRGHSGAIQVRSEPGAGTTIRALFPCSRRRVIREEPSTTVNLAAQGSGTVLVVDDEEMVRSVARQALERAGFNVLTAADGNEGIELFRQRADEIKIVLLDLTMPRLGGDEAFRVLRGIRDDVKVLLSSGYDEDEVASRFEEPGPEGCIQKPYRPEALVSRVREILGH